MKLASSESVPMIHLLTLLGVHYSIMQKHCIITQYGNWRLLGKDAGFWSFNTFTVSHIFVAARTKFVGLMSSPATACRHASQSRMKRLSTLFSGYLSSESHFRISRDTGNLKSSSMSTTDSVPELPLFSPFLELPEADDCGVLDFRELDDCVPEATDSGVDLPESDGLNSVDVGGDSGGGDDVNGLVVGLVCCVSSN